MKIQNIPNEFLQQIFQYSREYIVYQCIFVCKLWKVTAAEVYYKNFSLTGRNIRFLRQKLMYADDTNQNNVLPQLTTQGAYVRSLKIYKDYYLDNEFDTDELFTVLFFMPNLKKIDLSSSDKCNSYINILNNERIAECLKRLEEISVTFNKATIKGYEPISYFKTCYRYRESLKHLYLVNAQHIFGQSGNYLHFLPNFKCLTQLTMVNGFGVYTGKRDLLICPIFEACPNLTNFSHKSSFLLNNDTDEYLYLISAATHEIGENTASSIISTTSSNTLLSRQHLQTYYHKHYCSHLKTIELDVPYVSLECLKL